MSAGIVNVMYLVDVKNTGMEKNRTEMEKPDISELFRAHGFFGPPAGEEQNEGKSIEETDYLTAVDSLLSSVKPEPVDMGDEAILRRLRSTTECLKEYQEAINRADNLELSEEEGEDEAAAEEVGEAAGDVLGIPVPTVSAEAEELLRGARTLHRQTAELRSFLKDLLLEEGQGDGVRAPSCPEMEESTVDKIDTSNPENLLKVSKKGKTLMSFVSVDGNPTREETEDLTKLWQTGLWNSHIQAERYIVDDDRAIFMFKDGAQAWDAKEFLIDQERCKSVVIESKTYHGKHSAEGKAEAEKERGAAKKTKKSSEEL